MQPDGKVIIGTEIDTTGIEDGIGELDDSMQEFNKLVQKANEETNGLIGRLQELYSQYKELTTGDVLFESDIKQSKELKQEIIAIIDEIQKLTGEQFIIKGINDSKEQIQDINKEIGKIGNSITRTTKNVVKWGLAIFGIQGTFSMIRNSMNVISQQDQQLASDIEYMRNALAYALEPIVRVIVNLMKELMQIIGGIIYMWTGKNIFENANKSLKSANKQAKDLKKQLAGFDEMNILQDTSGGGSGGGATTPSIDLTNTDANVKKVEEIESKWKKFGNTMKEDLDTLSLTDWFKIFGPFGLAIKGVEETFYGFWEIVDGFFEFVKGIVDLIVGLVTGDSEKINKAVIELLDGLWKVIDGFWNILKGGFDIAIGLIIGIIGWLLEQGWNLLKGIGKWIYDNVIKPIADFFVGLWNGIIDGVKNAIKWIKDTFNSIVTFFSGIINKILGLFKTIGTSVGNVIGSTFKTVINGVLGAIESILNFPIKSINKLIDVINKVPGISLGKLSTFNLPRLAKGGIVNNPGPGVMMGSYIAGEKGPEAVIPLDDNTLDRLGLAFARHTSINTTIPIYVGNRQIARELRKINAEDDFAFNG